MKDKTLVAGDWHGNLMHAERVMREAARLGATRVLQIGDFGYGWSLLEKPSPGSNNYCAFTQEISRLALEVKIPVYWIDGNHENFDLLEAAGAFAQNEPVGLLPDVTYLPRGVTLEWGGQRWLFLGGAHSVDKAHRTPHQSWWEQEELDLRDVARALGHVNDLRTEDFSRGLARPRPIDVMAVHDAPLHSLVPGDHSVWAHKDQDTRPNREKLMQVALQARPALLVHGHYHVRYTAARGVFAPLPDTLIEGLAGDGAVAGSTLIVEAP